MKVTTEGVVTAVTSFVGILALVFGISADTVSEINSIVPQVVGAIMTLVSTVSYIINRRKGKETAALAIANIITSGATQSQSQQPENGDGASPRSAHSTVDEAVMAMRAIGLV